MLLQEASEGVRQVGQETEFKEKPGKITAEITRTGMDSDDGADRRYWLEIITRAEE